MGVADHFLLGKIYKCTRQQFIMIKVLFCVVSVLRLSKLNYSFITMTQEIMTQLNVFIVKLDWVGPVNNRPSSDKIHHFVPFCQTPGSPEFGWLYICLVVCCCSSGR